MFLSSPILRGRAKPVSYTHLDVYKRQLRARLGTDVPDDRAKEAESSKPVAAPQGQKIPPETAKPASYGHRPPEEMMTEETNFMSFFEKKDEE